MLACRDCRRQLTAAEGCALCMPIKANLVTTEENAEEYPALSDVGGEAVAALRTILQAHRNVMKNRLSEPKAVAAAELGVVRVANTLAKVLESARKLQTDGLAAVRNMPFKERAKLFALWYQSLPPAYRSKVRDGQAQFELQAGTPLALPPPQRESVEI